MVLYVKFKPYFWIDVVENWLRFLKIGLGTEIN